MIKHKKLQNNINIALAGPQGAGKTTLAKEWSTFTDHDKDPVPFISVKTSDLMPEGIKNHTDILKLSTTDPQAGVLFQKNLIESRTELFKSNYNSESGSISDRSVVDSFAYYSIHNSMFTDYETDQELRLLTENSIEYSDITVLLNPNLSEIKSNSVRFVSLSYYQSVGSIMRSILEGYYDYNEDAVAITISKLLKIMAHKTVKGTWVAEFIEPQGFSTTEDRLLGLLKLNQIISLDTM